MCFFRSRNIVNDKQAVCIKKENPTKKPLVFGRETSGKALEISCLLYTCTTHYYPKRSNDPLTLM